MKPLTSGIWRVPAAGSGNINMADGSFEPRPTFIYRRFRRTRMPIDSKASP